MTPTPWVIRADETAETDHALAERLGLSIQADPPDTGFYLLRREARLGLYRADTKNSYPLVCDLLDTAAQRGTGARRSPLARACGLQRTTSMTLCDTTAGLGRDSVMLAWLGATVTPIERQPAIAALLDDAWQRLAALGTAAPAWAARLARPVVGEAREQLAALSEKDRFDTIYLDPMFAAARRKAAPQKALAWLGELAGPDLDAGALFEAARHVARHRVVVKQHARSTPLGVPDQQIRAKAIRFDIYRNI